MAVLTKLTRGAQRGPPEGARNLFVTRLVLELPGWARSWQPRGTHFVHPEERMQLVVELASRNLERRTGGPFAAAVFERPCGRLVSIGVNRVVPNTCSIAHAEIMALGLAQARLGTYDLGGPGMHEHELVTGAEPCAMCLGAIPWSGVRSVMCGARTCDVAAIGFDEGPRPRRWVAALERRGIEVRRDVLRAEMCAVLAAYRSAGGKIYSSREG